MAPLDGRWAPSRYHKEFQRAIAFRSYISILRSGVRKKQTQESILERLFHKGETNEHGELVRESLLDQAIKATGQFCGLCDHDRQSYISIDSSTGGRKEEVRLIVQDCFTRTKSVRFVIGESFTRESLSLAKLSDNKKLVSGRTLRAGAEFAHFNGKKAYRYAMQFLDENMNLPPNKTVNDYDTFILTMMWKEQNQSWNSSSTTTTTAAVSDTNDKFEEVFVPPTKTPTPSTTIELGEIPPVDWIFDGWYAFRLYGPIVHDSMLEYKTDAFANPPEFFDDNDDDDEEKQSEVVHGKPTTATVAKATITRCVGRIVNGRQHQQYQEQCHAIICIIIILTAQQQQHQHHQKHRQQQQKQQQQQQQQQAYTIPSHRSCY